MNAGNSARRVALTVVCAGSPMNVLDNAIVSVARTRPVRTPCGAGTRRALVLAMRRAQHLQT